MECIQKHALADVVPIVEEHPDQAEVCEPLPKEESVDSNFEDRSCSLSDCNSQPGEHDDELNMY